jgi:hypothetical protein
MLKGRWLLRTIIYVIEEPIIDELGRHGVDLDFAVRHFKDVVKEFGVEIDFRSELALPASVPERVYATSRLSERHGLTPVDVAANDRTPFRPVFPSATRRSVMAAWNLINRLSWRGGTDPAGRE